MLFLIAATWLKRHSVNLRWFGTVIFLGGMLFLANIARVAVLVVVDQVIGSKLFAELIHVPLGVVAFLVACGAALLLLQRHAPETTAVQAGSILNREAQAQRPFWFAPVLASMLALMALLYQPQPQTVSAQASIEWAFPAQMHAQPSPLTPELYAWVTQDGAEMADRWNFRWEDGESSTSGALMFLTSSTWRGQHRPERCFEVQGQKVESSQTVMFAEDLPARFLHLSRGPVQVSALYWFQTGNRVTDDFATRIWADLAPENQRWVLVTILLNELYPADDDGLQSIAVAVRSVVANSMKGELP
jgi:exosortase O